MILPMVLDVFGHNMYSLMQVEYLWISLVYKTTIFQTKFPKFDHHFGEFKMAADFHDNSILANPKVHILLTLDECVPGIYGT